VISWRALPESLLIHIVKKTADVVAGQVTFQCPGRVGITDGYGHVRDIAQHHAFVSEGLVGLECYAINNERHIAEKLHFQAGSGDNEVSWQVLAGLKANPGFSEFFDVVCHY